MTRLGSTALIALMLAAPAIAQDGATATANFMTEDGNEAGTVTLTQGADGVMLEGTITGVIPGEHGLHFSQTSSCDGSNAEATNDGGDWINLGTVAADGQGNVRVEVTTADISLTEGEGNYALDEDGAALILDNGANNTSADNGVTASGNGTDEAADASTAAEGTDTSDDAAATTAGEAGAATDADAMATEAPAETESTDAAGDNTANADSVDAEAAPAVSSGDPVLCAVIEAGAAQ